MNQAISLRLNYYPREIVPTFLQTLFQDMTPTLLNCISSHPASQPSSIREVVGNCICLICSNAIQSCPLGSCKIPTGNFYGRFFSGIAGFRSSLLQTLYSCFFAYYCTLYGETLDLYRNGGRSITSICSGRLDGPLSFSSDFAVRYYLLRSGRAIFDLVEMSSQKSENPGEKSRLRTLSDVVYT